MAKKTANIDISNTINKGLKQVKDATKNANDYLLETSEEVVDFGLKRSTEWQGVAEKAINGGLKLTAKQQDLVFDSLEMVKSQVVRGSKRFKTLFSKN